MIANEGRVLIMLAGEDPGTGGPDAPSLAPSRDQHIFDKLNKVH